MTPYEYQLKIAKEAYTVLQRYGLVFFAMEERTGKTLASIVLAEMTIRKNVLVVTKKGGLMGEKEKNYKTAKEGWFGTLNAYATLIGKHQWLTNDGTLFTVVNYHGIHTKYKTPASKTAYKLNFKKGIYDLIILDESHNYLSAYPKVGVIWKSIRKLTDGLPVIYLSATPNAQGYQLLFNQLRLSNWSPFKAYKDFYRWFEYYGIPSKVRTAYGLQETYKKCKVSAWEEVKHLFITYTRKELGFEHEPNDVLHYVELDKPTKELYNKATEELILPIPQVEEGILLDSSMKERTSLHMLEGGVAKNGDDYYVLNNDEKIQAILRDFGDSEYNYIMYHYKAEHTKLEKYFKNTRLLQATSNAEGVDLSMYKIGIIYSQDWSTARHSQRRARQANKNRKEPINVHYYLVKDAISDQVYDTVSINKTNFIDSLYERKKL